MSAALRWLVLGLGVATFLVAAKAHGRQLRLERELAGYWEVTFGAQNPAWVEALWRRERLLYWTLAAGLALATVAFRLLAPRFAWPLPAAAPGGERSVIGAIVLHVAVPLIGAFVVTGLLSLARFALAPRGSVPAAAWWSAAAWGAAGWWALTIGMSIALVLLAWRKPV
jgi:hypothetical protein